MIQTPEDEVDGEEQHKSKISTLEEAIRRETNKITYSTLNNEQFRLLYQTITWKRGCCIKVRFTEISSGDQPTQNKLASKVWNLSLPQLAVIQAQYEHTRT